MKGRLFVELSIENQAGKILGKKELIVFSDVKACQQVFKNDQNISALFYFENQFLSKLSCEKFGRKFLGLKINR